MTYGYISTPARKAAGTAAPARSAARPAAGAAATKPRSARAAGTARTASAPVAVVKVNAPTAKKAAARKPAAQASGAGKRAGGRREGRKGIPVTSGRCGLQRCMVTFLQAACQPRSTIEVLMKRSLLPLLLALTLDQYAVRVDGQHAGAGMLVAALVLQPDNGNALIIIAIAAVGMLALILSDDDEDSPVSP